MKIETETKYSISDVVYYICNYKRKLTKGYVRSIKLDVEYNNITSRYLCQNDGYFGSLDFYDEHELFKTKEELINSL